MQFVRGRRRRRKRHHPLGPNRAEGAMSMVLTHYGIAKEIREHRILIQWHKVVGPRIAKHCTPNALAKGTLWVRVDSSSWMHQLSFLKEEIITKANQLCGKDLVHTIRFHLGRYKLSPTDPISAAVRIRRVPPPKRPLPPAATGHQLAAIEQEASQIEDDDLRSLVVDVRRRLNL